MLENTPTTTQTQWVDLCALQDLTPGKGQFIQAHGRRLAVFRLAGDVVRVIDDTCPHAGASLAAGWVENDCVTCPWHAWSFNLHDGRMPDSQRIAVPTFAAKIEAGRVWADLSKPQPTTPQEPREE